MKLYNGYERLPRNYTLMTDKYQHTMGNGYMANGMEVKEAVFDLFFREVPNGGGYMIMAGLDQVIPYIENIKYDERTLEKFRKRGYRPEFIEYLRNFKFTGSIYAIPDGTPVFPNEPLITVKAPLIQAQIIETAMLSMVNGAIKHATGARRLVEAAPKGVGIIDFSSRRCDGPEASIDAALYAMMAGCVGTSNEMVADMLNIESSGTMSHSWIQSFPSEYEAFLAYAKIYKSESIFLVDTYDTLKSGVPNAIRVALEYLIPNGYSLKGIRIDSGNIAYLSKEARKMLDAAGLTDVKIMGSGGQTDKKIKSNQEQGDKLDALGVGDAIAEPGGLVGAVYKEVAIEENGILVPKIKLSNSAEKRTNPGHKKLYRAYDKTTGYAIADIMTRQGEKVRKEDLLIIDVTNVANRKTINNFRLQELQKPIFVNGELVYYDPEIFEKQAYCNAQMKTLYPEVKIIEDPHRYYVDGTQDYIDFKDQVVAEVGHQLVKVMN